jgi:glycosyltransferase involved in cell wall biosynthesis
VAAEIYDSLLKYHRSNQHPVKILVFTTLFPNNIWPNHGIFIKERMASVAQLEGRDVRVVAPVPYHPPFRLGWRWNYSQVVREEVIDGIQVYHPRYFVIPKIGMTCHGLMMFLSVAFFVKKLQRQFDFDIIDAHYVYPDGFAAVLLGAVLRKPVVVSARGSDINHFPEFPFVRRLIRFTLDRTPRIIAVSQALKEATMRLGVPQDKITVIPNGVRASRFFPYSRREARRRLGLSDDRNIVLSVGGLTSIKGFDSLIEAAKMLVEEYHEEKLSLIVVGEGKLRGQLERMVRSLNLESHVQLVGSVPHGELYLWYNAANVFCLASKREGWPNVILEALACGIPVVGAAVGGIPEIIVNEEIGLVTGSEPAALASRIREAIHREWNSERIVRYASHLTWDITAASLCQVFDAVINGQ